MNLCCLVHHVRARGGGGGSNKEGYNGIAVQKYQQNSTRSVIFCRTRIARLFQKLAPTHALLHARAFQFQNHIRSFRTFFIPLQWRLSHASCSISMACSAIERCSLSSQPQSSGLPGGMEVSRSSQHSTCWIIYD